MKIAISVTLTPAYGRKYHSLAEVETDFNLGRDFHQEGAPGIPPSYCSIRNFEPGTELEVLYGPNLRKHGTIVVPKVAAAAKGGDSL